MKKYFLLMLITLSLGFTACSDDDTEATLSSVSIANEEEQTEIQEEFPAFPLMLKDSISRKKVTMNLGKFLIVSNYLLLLFDICRQM